MTAAPSIRAPRRKNRELMRRLLRLLISYVITLVLVDCAWRHVSATLHGKSDVVDYPLSVNFNVNRHRGRELSHCTHRPCDVHRAVVAPRAPRSGATLRSEIPRSSEWSRIPTRDIS